MGKHKYAITGLDPDRTAKAVGRDVDASPKQVREICNVIRGMSLEKAKNFLYDVVDKKTAVPFKRHNKKQAHRKGMDRFKWDAGRYPIKAARQVLLVIENAVNNAEYKGLDIDRIRVRHAMVHRAPVVKKYIPRAFRRSTPYFKRLSHIEIVLQEE
ncbi:MAG: 50S ribosomal protein L22 [Candidatus Lokiarchaeota archaeon]|nr:50S ribosomal protein L22 [Candidatus Lokiarchaeota archaeon]